MDRGWWKPVPSEAGEPGSLITGTVSSPELGHPVNLCPPFSQCWTNPSRHLLCGPLLRVDLGDQVLAPSVCFRGPGFGPPTTGP